MKKLLSFFFLLSSFTAFGQISRQQNAELDFNYIPIKNNDTSAHVRLIELKIGALVYKSTKSRLLANLNYTGESFTGFPAAYGTDVYGLSLGLNWFRTLGKRTALNIFGQAGFYSDLHTISDNAIRGLLGFNYLTRYSPNFSLGFGVAYARQFYGNQLIPVIVVLYHFDNQHWKLGGVFPTNPKLTYTFDKKNGISLELKQIFSSYRLTEPDDANSFIKNTRTTLMLNYEYSFTKSWRIAAGIGYAIQQKYELYKNDDGNQWYFINTPLGGAKAEPVESIIHNGAQFHIGIAFNPPF
jgi:hypothetical protein